MTANWPLRARITLRYAVLGIAATMLAACDEPPGPGAGAVNAIPDLAGSQWQVDDVDGGGVIDRSQLTLEFADRTRLAGSSGCNRYFGNLVIGAGTFRVSAAGSTEMACVESLMRQEERFMQALLDTMRFELDGSVLSLYDVVDKRRIRAVRRGSTPAASVTQYDCAGGLQVGASFIGQESVRLLLPDAEHELRRERSASGARYTKDALVFWEKGGEALLDIDGVTHHCRRNAVAAGS